ncbi:MAG: fatty acyl-AMP ligase [Proteobacteria bacterium]|nr:fatty acyl-AMP ligase [Pseudomonadota bacterium]
MPLFTTVAEAISKVGNTFPENGYVFQDLKGNETRYTFAEIDSHTATRAAAIQALGLRKGSRAGLVIIEPEDFVLTFLACIRVGVLPVPLYPPMSFTGLDAYAERTAKILTGCGASLLIASGKLQNILWNQVDRVPSLQRLVKVDELHKCETSPVYPEITPEDLAFLQYTSGSTSAPKGVMVSHASLIANCDAIVHGAMKMDPANDVAVSWLPLYHDMGLIGFCIATVTTGMTSVFIPTLRFIQRPSVWMDTIHRHRAAASFAPNFAYALITRRARPKDLEKWDLSCLNILGCGAEPIQADTMRAFLEKFHEHCGLSRNTIIPAYGMAEATLAMAMDPTDKEFSTNIVDAGTFQNDGIAVAPIEGKVYAEHVSCGPLLPGHTMKTVDDNGNRLPEGVEGELCFGGPSVTPGYFRNVEATKKAFRDGWLHTGDLGYIKDDEVYVTGRIKDLIILNGRNVHPQSVEWEAAEVDGVRKGNVVAFAVPGRNSEQLVVALESRLNDREALAKAVKTHIQKEMSLVIQDVVCLKPGSLPKTSSGKLQRHQSRQQYIDGALGTGVVRGTGKGGRATLAKHVAQSIWTRAKAAANVI